MRRTTEKEAKLKWEELKVPHSQSPLSPGAQKFRELYHKHITKTSTTQYENISSSVASIISLSEWMDTYGIKTDQLLGRKRETFRDQNGILRYLDNWHEVQEDAINNELLHNENDFYNLTGCVKVRIVHLVYDQSSSVNPSSLLPTDEGIPQSSNEKESDGKIERDTTVSTTAPIEASSHAISEKVSFLNDWKILWDFLSNDNEDEIAEQAPLLRLFVETFFHFRTCQLMVFLFLYNYVVFTICLAVYPRALDSALYIYDYVTTAVWLGTYFGIVYLYRGRISFTETNHMVTNGVSPGLASVNNRRGSNQRGTKRKSALGKYIAHYSVHWSSTIRQLWSYTINDIKLIWSEHRRSVKERGDLDNERQKRLSFYEILNISLKFLTRHNGINPHEINFNRPIYRLFLIFTVTVFPIFVFVNSYASEYLTYIGSYCARDDNISTEFCHYFLLLLILSLGTLSKFVMQYIFGASVLVSLVGLAYGGEIAFRLSNSWIQKYACLRRVNYNHSSLLVSDEKFFDNTKDDNAISRKHESTVSSEDETISALHRHSVEPLHKLEKWKTSGEESKPTLSYDYGISVHSLNDLLRRDATEHYFFIQGVLAEAGRIWSPALTALILLAVYIVAAYLSYLILFAGTSSIGTKLWIQLGMLMAVRVLFLVIFPIASVCHANNFMFEIKESFVNSSPEDFTIIGGRDRWIKFIEVCPLVWSYYGIWITWDRLFGLIWTASAGLLAYFATTLTAGQLHR